MYIRLQPSVASTAVAGVMVSNNSGYDMNWLAERCIASIELTIGGQRIDKHYQAWWRLYAELFLGESDKINYGKMTSCVNPTADGTNPTSVYLPLLFFFNRNPGLYLPLIALQYHEVRMDFDLSSYFNSYFGTSSQVFEVWANYVYLDTEERRRFAQKGHEYLIEQVQHTGGDSVTLTAGSAPLGAVSAQTIRLSFNHPVKELIWCYQNTATSATNSMWNFSSSAANVNVTCSPLPQFSPGSLPHAVGAPRLYSNISCLTGAQLTSNVLAGVGWCEEGSSNVVSTSTSAVEVGPLYSFKLVLNGQDRFKEQSGKYFNQYQPYVYHTGTPYPGIYAYSFALQPEEHQPTGTCNFSRIDNAQVAISIKGCASTPLQRMFAVNYNILRIQSGMGGLAFSN
jgi:hypothetical protein